MEVSAKAKHIRISPRKLRLVIDVVRGMNVDQALDQLNFTKKLAKKPVIKLINSAVANAENNFELSKDNLYIKRITVDEGQKLQRWMPKAYGRAGKIRKRSSHIRVVLDEIVPSAGKRTTKKKIEAPIKLSEAPKEDKLHGKKSIVKDIEKEGQELKGEQKEKGKKIIDQRGEGKGKHTKIEGQTHRGLIGKVFRRKSG